jgi:DNA invertase Pin-like site-specific DNA recombinase
MRQLVADIQAGTVQTVIVTKADRIARSVKAFHAWMMLLKNTDVRCVSLDARAQDAGSEFAFWWGTYHILQTII